VISNRDVKRLMPRAGLGEGEGLGEREELEAWLKCWLTVNDWADDLQKIIGG
jgi:hypothetical protein